MQNKNAQTKENLESKISRRWLQKFFRRISIGKVSKSWK